ncbi:MAG: response regulator [Desulfobacteraceae bacterium]|nr:response regulator [Desulfobacteraceae bacterium]
MMKSRPEPVAKVLVADDDEVFQEILAETVEGAGAQVELVSDGVAALEQLAAGEFDILISDLNMPRMDGLTLLRQVRALYPSILSILVTGFGSLESAIEALRLGAYDYIQKPFMVEQVAVTIRNAIDKVTSYKEKAILLERIELLHQKLCLLEGRRHPELGPGRQMGRHLYRGIRPDTFLELPEGNPNRAITALENLKSLNREGVITDSDLERLKSVIIKKIESGGL